MLKIIVLATSLTLLVGCSGLAATVQSDPFRTGYISKNGESFWGKAEKDGNLIGIISLDATRRVVLVNLKNGKFCAEGPPDVGAGLNITSKVDASVKPNKATPEIKFGLDESYQSTIVKLSERTALLEIYRTGTQTLCQYHLNGGFDNDVGKVPSLIEAFNSLTNKVLEAYKVSYQPS